MALEDIGAAVTGFSQGMGLMNDWERQRLAVERERRLSEQAAQAAQLKQMGLTREILGEYGADAPQVMQVVGLPAPDAGLVGIFNRRAADAQLGARYAMDPTQVAEQLPNLPPEHPIWREFTKNPELRAAVGEERKLARARTQSREAATSYETARGVDQQMSVPGDMSVIERTALARAHTGDRKLLDDLLQRKMAAEATREALQGLGENTNRRMLPSVSTKGEVSWRPESARGAGAGTAVERQAQLLTTEEGRQPGTPEYNAAYLENLQLARYLGSSNVGLQAVGADALKARLSGQPMSQEQIATAVQAATLNSQVAAIRAQLQAAAKQNPRAPQPGTAAFAGEMDRRIQGNKEASARAYATGRYQAELDEKIGTKSANYLDPKTDQAPPAGMTQREAIERGVVEAAPKYREAIANLQPAKRLAQTLLDRADKLITADVSKAPGLTGAANTTWDVLMQRGRVEMGRITGTFPEAKSFMDQLEAFAGRISKSFAAEVGVLTDRDITRVVRGFPSPFVNDTKQSAAMKRQLIQELMAEAEGATRRVVYGGLPGAEARGQSRIDEILDRLDGATPGGVRPSGGAKPSGVLRMVVDPKTGRYVPAPQGGR